MTPEWMTVQDEADEAMSAAYWDARQRRDWKEAAQVLAATSKANGDRPVEVVLPPAFAEFVEGSDLLQTQDPGFRQDEVAVLIVWAGGTTSRKGVTLPLRGGDEQVLDWFADYADTMQQDGFTAGERRSAQLAANRIRQARAALKEASR